MKLGDFYYYNWSFLLLIFWSIFVGHLVFSSSATANGSTSQQNITEIERRCSSNPGIDNCQNAIKERNKLTIKQNLLMKLDLPESFKNSKFPKVPQKIIDSYLKLMQLDPEEFMNLDLSKRPHKSSVFKSQKSSINLKRTNGDDDDDDHDQDHEDNNDDDDSDGGDNNDDHYANDENNPNNNNDDNTFVYKHSDNVGDSTPMTKQSGRTRGAGRKTNGDSSSSFEADDNASDSDRGGIDNIDDDDVDDGSDNNGDRHSDLDDYASDSNELRPVPPKTIIIINKAHQKVRHKCSNKSDFFYFQASNSTRNYQVQRARLNFAVNLKHRQHTSVHQDVEFVFKIIKGCYRKTDNNYVPHKVSSTTNTVTNTNGPSIVQGILTVKKSYELLRKSKWWVEIDITKLVSKWFRNFSNNNGISLSIVEDNDLLEIKNTNEHKPFIIMDVKARKPRRSKRSSDLKCSESSRSRNCCRSPLTIDFDEFGWDFVLTPRRYEAYYCTGACPAAYKQMYTHTYVAQMSSAAIGPCCSPREYNNVSILYFDQDFNIRFSNLPGMVVAKCGCS